jgi:nucleotide-binding universal stress UspA family protein
MTSFQHILFPVDFSEQCRRVAPFVKAFADQFHSEVTMLHVYELPLLLPGMPDTPTWSVMIESDEARAARRAELETFLAGYFAGVKVHREMADGDAALQIACYANEKKVDLIMMPTHGYGRFRRLLLGSVTAKILHDADCPVWTSAHTPELTSQSPERCRRILCAVDTNPRDVEVIRWAAAFGKEQGAEVHLVHAIQGVHPDQFDSAVFYGFLTKFAQEELAKMQSQAGTAFKVSVPSGTPAEVVHTAAVEQDADLVVIGRGVLKEALGRLRSNGYSIIRDSPCPVISI